MPTDSLWMLALMNSEPIEFLLCQITSSLRGGFLQLNHQFTTRLPIVAPDITIQRRLEAVAQSGMNGDTVEDDELNEIVYWLYGLSDRDVALVKDWFDRRSLSAREEECSA